VIGRDAVVLVTGGTGFLGSSIARRLAARGDEVHVLARATSDRSVLEGVPVTWHAGDLGDDASIQAAAAAVAARAAQVARPARLVHCGALISYRRQDTEAQRVANVEGTRSVLAAAAAHGFARVLHVSSVVAVGHGRGTEVLDERIAWNNGPLGVDYATTKHAAERLAIAAALDLDVVVVNPGAIFGAWRHQSNTARFLRMAAAGKGPLVAPPGSIGVLGIDDAADGCVLALDRGRRGERYLLVERWMSSVDLFRLVARVTGGRRPWIIWPRFAWPLVVAGARALDRIRALEMMTPQALAMLGVELRFDARKAREELGWRPQPFEAVLRATVRGLGLTVAG
jgi:dihydroflavonol-4-reductase